MILNIIPIMNFLLSAFMLASVGIAAADLRGFEHLDDGSIGSYRFETTIDTDGVRRHLLPPETECVAYMRVMDLADGSDDNSWVCQFGPILAKQFGGTTMMELSTISKDFERMGVVSGGTILRIASSSYVKQGVVPNNGGATISSHVLYLSADADFEIERMDEANDPRHFRNRQRSRRLAKGTVGTMSVLVVRTVDGNNQETNLTKTQLEDDVFEDSVCLKSRYEECSHGKLTIEREDIIDVRISEVADDQFYKDIEHGIRNAIINLYGDAQSLYNQVDLVMYCQPPGSYNLDSEGNKRDWVAYAYVNGFESFYNDEWCGKVSGQVHEIGHNLGLAHSGLPGRSSYEDTSGMMGYSYNLDDGPSVCFNAAKSYQLRWYEDKVESIDPRNLPDGSQSFNLIGVADYDNADGLVSLRLEYEGNQNNGKEWYVGYNRKAGINSGVPNTDEAAPNLVHLIEKVNILANEYGYGQSERIAALDTNQQYSWDIGGTDVTLKVDSIDGAIASISIFGGIPAPSLPPTLPPTPLPGSPTPYPTNAGECITSTSLYDGRPGLLFTFEARLDDKSGSEFGWTLTNDRNGVSWSTSANFNYQNGAFFRYAICLPKFECFTLTLTDNGGDGLCCDNGDGYYKGLIDGEEIFSGGEFTGTEEREICIGREYCSDVRRGFRYKKKNRNRLMKSNCEEVDEERQRKKKKICKSTYGESGRKKVQQLCTETCGKAGLGPCNFLETYGNQPAAGQAITANGQTVTTETPGLIMVEPIPHNIFVHKPSQEQQ